MSSISEFEKEMSKGKKLSPDSLKVLISNINKEEYLHFALRSGLTDIARRSEKLLYNDNYRKVYINEINRKELDKVNISEFVTYLRAVLKTDYTMLLDSDNEDFKDRVKQNLGLCISTESQDCRNGVDDSFLQIMISERAFELVEMIGKQGYKSLAKNVFDNADLYDNIITENVSGKLESDEQVPFLVTVSLLGLTNDED